MQKNTRTKNARGGAPHVPRSYDVPNVEHEKTGLLSSEQKEGGPGPSLAYRNGTTENMN